MKKLAPLCCGLLLALAGSLCAAETELINSNTPWRVWMVMGKAAYSGPDGVTSFTEKDAELTRLPTEDWMGAKYDDSVWGRYEGDLQEWIGLYVGYAGIREECQQAVAYLRTRFGVADPARAVDLQLTIEYVGGIVAYVNGQEVGRGHLPAGALQPYTVATAYPMETYTLEDGVTPVPQGRYGMPHKLGDNPRVRQRVRTLNVRIPAQSLVKGANVLALAVYRAPVLKDAPGGAKGGRYLWRHQGIGAISLTSASGNGAIAWAEALKGTRVWSAQPLEQVANERAARILADWGRPGGPLSFMTFGLSRGNPFDPLLPVRVLVPRNGIGNGQTVLTDEAGLKDVTASLGALKGPGGAQLAGVRILYGIQGAAEGTLNMSPGHWCDALAQQAPQGAKTIPVWLEITASKNQPPGEYIGELALTANGRQFTVPVQVLVTRFTVPDPKDFHGTIIAVHSPEATAKQYNLRPYSEEHFRVMEKSLAFMGQLGNDLLLVPVIVGSEMGHQTGLIRWVKTAAGLKPDFNLFERYLDIYVKHCGQPKAMTLNVWSARSASEYAQAYENIRVPTRMVTTTKQSLTVTCWDPKTGTTEDVAAPQPTAEGAEAFWKPLLDGVHDIVVKKRGWPEKTILLGTGGDVRPSLQTGELFRKWAPYARWNLKSHFSGDPAPKDGKMIATGNLEIGLREMAGGDGLSARSLEALVQSRNEYLTTWIHREGPAMYSPPLHYRTGSLHGHWTRVGMDYWPKVSGRSGPGFFIWGEQPIWMTWPGADGAQPTVRFQMIREGLQDFEARLIIAKRIVNLPEHHRKSYRAILDEMLNFTGSYGGSDLVNRLPNAVLSFGWHDYVARIHAAAFEANCTGPMVNGTPADDPGITAAIRAESDPAKLPARFSEVSAHYRFEAVKRLGELKKPLTKDATERLVALALDDFYEEIRAQAVLALDACDPAGRAGWERLMTDYATNFWSDPPPKEGWAYNTNRDRTERRHWIQMTLRALGEQGRTRLERDFPEMAKDPIRLRIVLDIATATGWRIEPLTKACLEAAQNGPDAGRDRYNLGYLAAIDAASDPAAAEILLKAYAPNYISWVLYPTFARNLKAERFLAWMEPYALECSHPEKKPQILNAWKAIGKAALPSMERVKAAMEAMTPAQNICAASYAEDIARQIAEMKEEKTATP
jgi:hypothetical protein